ncbi:MAG: hypothetical protein KAR20_06730, partial [Candidatus Heimdallarchaeota archaeon]|nr:hypothetical protein [Candidatus Heimdallarchaeota archaeon]
LVPQRPPRPQLRDKRLLSRSWQDGVHDYYPIFESLYAFDHPFMYIRSIAITSRSIKRNLLTISNN